MAVQQTGIKNGGTNYMKRIGRMRGQLQLLLWGVRHIEALAAHPQKAVARASAPSASSARTLRS